MEEVMDRSIENHQVLPEPESRRAPEPQEPEDLERDSEHWQEPRELTNRQFAAVLRRIATVYEQSPDIPKLYNLTNGAEFVFCHSKESFAAAVKAFGPGRKDADAEDLLYFPELTRGTAIRINGFKSNMCERVKVGTKVIPAKEQLVIPEHVIPATPERTEDVYEWKCSPFLETPGGEEAA
jgi:hypothetical protein